MGRVALPLSKADREFLLFRLSLGSEDDPKTGCRVWQGGLNSKGYGTISIGGDNYYVHRVMYALVNGRIHRSNQVHHSCDNRRCIAPDHLFQGTPRDNHDDKRVKGHAYVYGRWLPPKELEFTDAETSAA